MPGTLDTAADLVQQWQRDLLYSLQAMLQAEQQAIKISLWCCSLQQRRCSIHLAAQLEQLGVGGLDVPAAVTGECTVV